MNRDELIAELDQLTPKEIEQRLSSWNKKQLLVVQEYLKYKKPKVQSRDEIARAASNAAWAAAETAIQANSKATIALVIAITAMILAIGSAVVVLLGLRFH